MLVSRGCLLIPRIIQRYLRGISYSRDRAPRTYVYVRVHVYGSHLRGITISRWRSRVRRVIGVIFARKVCRSRTQHVIPPVTHRLTRLMPRIYMKSRNPGFILVVCRRACYPIGSRNVILEVVYYIYV